MKNVTVSDKGWIVIPNEIREKYNLKKGDKVNVVDYGGIIAIIPVSKDVIKESAGIFKSKKSLTKLLLESRKEEIEREK
ncbi:MAG: AbrB/MazE/SpoVT family DNA-binding domain-containing protein [Cyanobacteria bacterium]|nr:AbrB/MazE/SpoVT family DNA-binding domain-containing protein [Cyanobacteriota bacterium]